jgi:hypothetical protein
MMEIFFHFEAKKVFFFRFVRMQAKKTMQAKRNDLSEKLQFQQKFEGHFQVFKLF